MADNKYKLQFTLSNGETINAGEIVAPQGPKGDKGDSATIDANTLIALLLGSNGIAIAKNAAGDKVEVKINNEGFTLGDQNPDSHSNYANYGNSEIYLAQGGGSGGVKLNRQSVSLIDGSGAQGVFADTSGISRKVYNSDNQLVTYAFLHENNVKTLFGNQSIYGSGNIDLYRHTVWFTAVSGSSTIVDCVLTVISSSNVAIDSLTDLFSVVKPMVSSGGTYPANGRVYNTSNNKYYTVTRIYPTSDGAMIGNTQDEEKWFSWTTPGTWSFQDKVTTV